MTETEQAAATLAKLEDKRKQLIEQNIELADERQRISFDAHAGNDQKARARLDKINAAFIAHTSEMASLESAIVEAQARLDASKSTEALQQDREQAKELRLALNRFHELGLIVDDCFADLTSATLEMKIVLDKMHQLGAPNPSSEQVRVLGAQAVKTALMQTPWAKEFDPIAPNQRRSFKSLVDGWRDMLMPSITRRTGEEKQEQAA